MKGFLLLASIGAISGSSCQALAESGIPFVDIVQVKESFSRYEGKRVVIHACTYPDPHGAVIVVSCDPSRTAHHIVTYMTVDRANEVALSQYESLFGVLGPAYEMDITATPRGAPGGEWHALEFESASGVSEVVACSLWTHAGSCN